jgi:predicted metal-dependent phosphoesterase TrpH
VLKAELHTHSGEDPVDLIPYDARTLIDHASALGYSVLAITLHDRQLDITNLRGYAEERGIVLIPGIERTICGKHVLLLNFPAAAADVTTFDDVRRLKARTNGLVIAPHPFFPTATCLGRVLDQHRDLFDAVELNAFYTRHANFNRRGVKWALERGKTVVANADVHRLRQLGPTFSLIDAEAHPDAVCEAIREGRVAVRTEPLTTAEAAWHIADLAASDCYNRLRRLADERSYRPHEAGGDDRLGDVSGVSSFGNPLSLVGGRETGDSHGRHLVPALARRLQKL